METKDFYVKEGDNFVGIDKQKLQKHFKELGYTEKGAAEQLTEDTIRNLREKNDRLSFHGEEVKFNNEPDKNNNIHSSDVEDAMKVAAEKLKQQQQVTEEVKQVIENNSEVETKDGKPKVTFDLKGLKEDLKSFALEKLRQAGSALQEFGSKVKDFLVDMANKLGGFIGGLIEGLFGDKANENKNEQNKAKNEAQTPKELNIAKSEDGNTATIEGKPSFDAKEVANAIGKFAMNVAKQAAKVVGKVVGATIEFGKELAESFKQGYNEARANKSSLEQEFAAEVASRGLNSQKEVANSQQENSQQPVTTSASRSGR